MKNICKEACTAVALTSVLAGCSIPPNTEQVSPSPSSSTQSSSDATPYEVAFQVSRKPQVVEYAGRICYAVGKASIGSISSSCDTKVEMNEDRADLGVNSDDDMKLVGSIVVSVCYVKDGVPTIMEANTQRGSADEETSTKYFRSLFDAAPVTDPHASAEGIQCVREFPMTKLFQETNTNDARIYVQDYLKLH